MGRWQFADFPETYAELFGGFLIAQEASKRPRISPPVAIWPEEMWAGV